MTTNIPQPQHTLRGRFTGYLADVEGHGLRGPLLPEEDVEAHGKMSGLVADGKYTGLHGEISGKNTP